MIDPVRRHTASVAVAFGVSAAASLGLTVVYALGGHPRVEGALLFLSLGGISVGFVIWGRKLMPQGPFVEERKPLASADEERGAVARDFVRREESLPRRTFLLRILLGALAALGAAAVVPIRSLGPSPGRSLLRTSWSAGARLVTAEGDPVTLDHLDVGGVVTVFPEGHEEAADSMVVLVRVDPREAPTSPGREGWAPAGYIAYSKICTHAGCPVGLYEPPTKRLFCPCHQSAFDVLDGAAPIEGPATRPLPQLPLEVDEEGFLRAQGDFPEPVGPAFWEMG